MEWAGAGSNRRHMDFQSIALPTELPARGDVKLVMTSDGRGIVGSVGDDASAGRPGVPRARHAGRVRALLPLPVRRERVGVRVFAFIRKGTTLTLPSPGVTGEGGRLSKRDS